MRMKFSVHTALRRRQSFHRVGITAACMTILAGLAFIAAAVVRLDLLDALQGDVFLMTLGCALLALGILSIASYGVVRAIEWASRR
jgi:hypothetical protein